MAEHWSHPLDTLPFDTVPPAGHYGVADMTGVAARRIEGLSIATLAPARGAEAAITETMRQALAMELPGASRAVFAGARTLIGTAPGRWLALSSLDRDIAGTLRAALGPLAAITDQSDAFIALDLAGPKVADTLAKGALIDLDPRVFLPGMAATTVLAHIGITLWRREEATWRLLVARSFEAALLRFLVSSAAEYGFELDARG
ncbi:sarcosine oxidase subunit gamma [Ancylobacter amanitiformis]|uniref:Sarcosine oxidase subunit gamma n=1 Tax=Ancylobacter amanitiformis TaxID=217069 RepID=A0ABU0LSD9_9HYPH|nr:sarcosine oxidase subunit gamma family protein [Ancylobacter amanitiformis]MDQ0511624.1 sarcosine oxidase subunit gamma [Ancylobacter amanitiformis]